MITHIVFFKLKDRSLRSAGKARDDLQAYQKHPVHVEVAKDMTSVRESAAAVDYESE